MTRAVHCKPEGMSHPENNVIYFSMKNYKHIFSLVSKILLFIFISGLTTALLLFIPTFAIPRGLKPGLQKQYRDCYQRARTILYINALHFKARVD
jgi:hypothetical protein